MPRYSKILFDYAEEPLELNLWFCDLRMVTLNKVTRLTNYLVTPLKIPSQTYVVSLKYGDSRTVMA